VRAGITALGISRRVQTDSDPEYSEAHPYYTESEAQEAPLVGSSKPVFEGHSGTTDSFGYLPSAIVFLIVLAVVVLALRSKRNRVLPEKVRSVV
jgi:hypothetical protein